MATKTRKTTTTTTTKLQHLEGCPAERTETYTDVTPPPERDEVRISRCLDCGAHLVEPERR
jgi:hypothetical protein